MNRREWMLSGAAAALPFAAAAQQAFPSRPIKLVVPFAPGGVVDVIGRLWAAAIEEHLGPVTIENQGAAGGIIGATAVARAQPDGYTLLMGNTSTQVINPAVMDAPPYDAAKAFTTIGVVANSAVVFAVHPSVPAGTLGELVAHIKANPAKKFAYGSPGAGTLTHLAGEILKQVAGLTDFAHAPYRGAGPGMTDLVGGHIPVMAFNLTGQGIELHKAGKIRIVATCAPRRLDYLPDIAAAAETYPNLVAQLFTGLFAPAATPAAIVARVAAAHLKIATNEAFRKRLVETGLDPVADTPAEAQKFVDEEIARLVPLVKAIGFKPG